MKTVNTTTTESVNIMERSQKATDMLKPTVKNGVTTYPSEHLEQVHFVAWFRREYPGIRIFAIPNGGGRSKAQAGQLKAEGVSAGVPDLYIPALKTWIEMKRQKGGTVTPAQKDWHEYLRSIGDTVFVCKGFLEAKEIIERYLNYTTRTTENG